MKRPSTLFILVAITLVATPLLAKEQGLYFNVGAGWAQPKYEPRLEDVLEELEDLPGMSRVAFALDLGLYWPLGRRDMLGPAVSGMGDRFELNGEDLQLNSFLLGISYRRYYSGERGRGFFFRGDAGLARVVIQDSEGEDFTSDIGGGILVGGGYSFQIGDGTWFSLNADYAIKNVESDQFGGLSIGGAFLF